MSLIQDLQWRYATKKFDSSKKLSDEQLDNLLSAVQLAPSSMGLQAYKVIVVEDNEIRQQLRAAAYGQFQITDASQVIIFAAETKLDEVYAKNYIDLIADTRQTEREQLLGFEQMINGTLNKLNDDQKMLWTQKQAYIGLGILLTAAAEQGIDACPMEGFDAVKFNEILGLNELGLHATVIAPVGFRAADDVYSTLTKVRRPKEEMFIHF